MKNFEKAKLLRDIRKSIGWTQVQLSAALELDATYLSQLENGRKPLDDSYLKKAQDIKTRIENSNKVKGSYGEGGSPGMGMKETSDFLMDVKTKCHRHIDRYLAGCNGDREQMAWALVELRRRFPVASSLSEGEIPDQIARDILEGGSSDHAASGPEIEKVPPRKTDQ